MISRPVFFLSAKTQHQNLGDGIITRELIHLLEEFGDVHLNEAGMPAGFLNLVCGQRTIRYSGGKAFIFALVSSYLGVRRNGNDRHLYYVLNPGGFSGSVRILDLPRHLLLIGAYALFQWFGIRTVRLGQSVGPFTDGRLLLERMKARFAYLLTARDHESLAYARDTKIAVREFFPDLALLLPDPGPGLANRSGLVCSFRSEPDIDGYDEAIECFLMLARQGDFGGAAATWRFCSQVIFDDARNRQLALSLSAMHVPIDSKHFFDFDYFCQQYGAVRAVLSNRLHVLLFALRMGTPAFAVIDPVVNRKVAGIYNELGLQEFIVDVRSVKVLPALPDTVQFADHAAQLFASRATTARALAARFLD